MSENPLFLSRRALLSASLLAPALTHAADTTDKKLPIAERTETDITGSVAIVDTSRDTTAFAERLANRHVVTVGRYFARGYEPHLPEKRLKPAEAGALLNAGLDVLSIYEYKSNHAGKFLEGLPDTGSAEAEAEADAAAALQQAQAVAQPPDSAIFFAVDFDLTPKTKAVSEAILAYFRRLNQNLSGHYRIGVYGSGYANRILREAGLIEYTWLSSSVEYTETATYYREADWNLFQNLPNLLWFSDDHCSGGLPVDSNVQNPKYPDFGAWGKAVMSQKRAESIFDARRFALRDAGVRALPDLKSGSPTNPICVPHGQGWRSLPYKTVYRGWNVRVLRETEGWLLVDLNEDGLIDGYVQVSDFTEHFLDMP